MLPYQAAVAMDYAGYQRQPTPGHPGSHMPATMGPLAMPAVPFSHSWMVPTQDLCAMPYNKIPGHQQPPGPGMHAQQQPIEPGLVTRFLRLKKIHKFREEIVLFLCLFGRIETIFLTQHFNDSKMGFQSAVPKIIQNQNFKMIIGNHSRYVQTVSLNK